MGTLSPDSSEPCVSLRLLGSREANHPLEVLRPVARVSSPPVRAAGTATLTSPADGGSRVLVSGAECAKPWQGSQTAPKRGAGRGQIPAL